LFLFHWSPVHYACHYDNIEVLNTLKQFGADLNASRKGGISPIHTAISQKSVSITRFLIENGAIIDIADNQGLTPLHHAAKTGHIGLIELLLSKSANPMILDKNGEPPLFTAIVNNNIDAVGVLISHGLNHINNKKQTGLHLASMNGCVDIARRLIDGGININLVDCYQNTALHYASMSDSSEIINSLLVHSADATIRNTKGKSPFFYASSRCAKIFRHHFQNENALQQLTAAHSAQLGFSKNRAPILKSPVRQNSPKKTEYKKKPTITKNEAKTKSNSSNETKIDELKRELLEEIHSFKSTVNNQMDNMMLLISEMKDEIKNLKHY